MVDVSESALQVLADYIGTQEINKAIRITPMAGNCAGPHLRLRACEAQASDSLFQHGDVLFVVNHELLAECGSIRVDYVAACDSCCCSGGCAGFRISGKKKYPFAGKCVTAPNRCDLRCGNSSLSSASSCAPQQVA